MSVNSTSSEEEMEEEEAAAAMVSVSSNWTQQNVYSPELGSANVMFPSPGTAINSSLEHGAFELRLG